MNIRINFSPWFPKSSIVTPKGSTPMVWYGKRRSSYLTGNIWLWGRFICVCGRKEHCYFLCIDKPVLSADVRGLPSCSPNGRKQKGESCINSWFVCCFWSAQFGFFSNLPSEHPSDFACPPPIWIFYRQILSVYNYIYISSILYQRN